MTSVSFCFLGFVSVFCFFLTWLLENLVLHIGLQCILLDGLVQTSIWAINLCASDLRIKVLEEGSTKGFANFAVLPGKAYGPRSLKCKHYVV